MAKVLCVSNQKGGVGKTTTVNALAMGLRRRGSRVLCVDFDPQGNLSFTLRAAGILLTRFNPREKTSKLIRDTVQEIAKTLDIPLLDTYIHASVALTKAQILQQDLTAYPARNKAVADYGALVDELLQKGVL